MPETYRRRILSVAYCLLSEIAGPFDSLFRVLVSGNGSRVQFQSRPGEFSGQHVSLSEIQEAVLNCFDEGDVLKGETIARRTGYAYGQRLRTTLAAMCRPPVHILEKTGEGYRVKATCAPRGAGSEDATAAD